MFVQVAKLVMAGSLIAAAGLGLSGCVQEHLSRDFGVAVRQDFAAQVADPDARYAGVPGSTGPRTALSQDHYDKGKVTAPAAASASKVGVTSGGSEAPPQ